MQLLIPFIIIGSVLVFATRNKRRTPPVRTEKQKQADELITVILPTISNDK